MTAHAKRVVLAAAVVPWTVIVVSFLVQLVSYALAPKTPPPAGTLVWPDPRKPVEWVQVAILFCVYGIPTAYVSLLVFVPIYYIVRHVHAVSYLTMLAAGGVTCLPAALFFGGPRGLLGSFAAAMTTLLPFGVVAAACFLWIIRRAGNAEPPC
jgi:hypothetical protein